MWFAILGGVAFGVLATMFMVVRQERGYRLLFSDTHLKDFAAALERARAGEVGTTYEGVSLTFERLPRHVALTLGTRRAIAPAAAGFLCAFALECMRAPTVEATLKLAGRRHALVIERDALDLATPFITAEGELAGLRARAADRMRGLAITEATLAAYR